MSEACRPRLDALAARIRDDLARTAHPRAPWLAPRAGPDGAPARDVIVVGAGQSGLAVAFGLLRAQVTNILVLDRAGPGREGPWLTYARMRTLRSPKDFTGPDLGLPSLTYQSWHEARYGAASWADLGLIAREDWAAYLAFVREVTGVPVENGAAVSGIAPAGGLLAVTAADGRVWHARKVVLATGQEGAGRWSLPPALAGLPEARRAQASEPIDFAGLAGRRVAVVGAGASAFDNAATALEAGAASVHLLCRRPEPQVIQPYRWLTFAGFLRHLGDLDDAWRWRFMSAILRMREGFPQATWDRCAHHPRFRFEPGAPVLSAALADDAVVLATPRGRLAVDFVIAATGIEIDFAARPELAAFAHNIATWGDRYDPPEEERDPRLAAYPYLADDYAFVEREPGRTPYLADIHLFGIASTMSHGPSGSSINAMTTAVPRLVAGLTRGLFVADLDRHWADFRAYDVPQAVLQGRRPDPRDPLGAPEAGPAPSPGRHGARAEP
ncbi:FAD-dependent urate hydroxylase [Methylobacterium crusticola]|uniref:FAD-dependent urate hydroxylase n=1 Tax=Methylobacterium crusticola TaxID=1697972 RepID=A0ABQ4R378_9HYPH|nr:NAD(P)/FAD-dependent oxidoreductase [Methylobacterium crusticola]GJD52126.1 FAD-dependent urate hydroxylase [Methylobacterium crusticola]